MKPLTKIARIAILGCVLAIVHASASQAVVTVSHVDSTGGATIPVGGTFTVDVNLDYDGSPVLTGVFTSIGYDPAQLSLLSFTPAPFAIFFGSLGFLSNIAQPSVFPGDLPGTLRTIQYGASPGQSAGAGPTTLITTLTFEVVGEGDGTAELPVIFSSGDIILGAAGAELLPPDTAFVDAVVNVPEPSSAALALSALGTVGWVVRRRSRHA